jgi:tetratricopeptide (TPR) repeat protein
MAKIGRNDLCPCGSGKKYKKCCQDKPALPGATPPSQQAARHEDPFLLDELSNSVLGLIQQKRFDDALAVCNRLVREYPEVVDGLERSALVHEARGSWELAASFYRRALAFTEQPEQHEGFDEEGRFYFRNKIAEAEARARAA